MSTVEQLQQDKPVPSVSTYVLVWLGLLALLAATVGSSFVPLGPWNTVLNLGIAATKAALVALFFMHLKEASPLIRIVAVGTLLWWGLLGGLTLTDYLMRGS